MSINDLREFLDKYPLGTKIVIIKADSLDYGKKGKIVGCTPKEELIIQLETGAMGYFNMGDIQEAKAK
jgi:hypothetical protein